jgi:dTDP-4-amino-4,6-dideoxygalactose transaminase
MGGVKMILGGSQNIDLELLQLNPQKSDIELRCDMQNVFNRKKYLNTGRAAAIYLFQHCGNFKENDVVLLPDYLCLSIVLFADAAKLKYRFYRIDRELNIDIEDLKNKIDEDVKAIYVISYFGFPQKKEIVDELKKLREEKNIALVEDITQTFFSKDKNCMGFGDYIVCSTRKWMPMTDGGLLAVRDGVKYNNVKLESGYNEAAYKQLLISLMRDYFNEHPDKDKTFYIELEKEATKDRDTDLTVREMTPIAKRIMIGSDTKKIMRKRRENYTYLYNHFKNHAKVTVVGRELDKDRNYVPFGLLILVEDRDAFNDYMIKHNIIGEIQWVLPIEYYVPGQDAKYLSAHNLMIRCDQRYGEKEMKYIVETINNFFK